jgi:hypothetical protein
MRTAVIAGLVLLCAFVGWWAWRSLSTPESERVAVLEEQVRVAKADADREAATVAALREELEEARSQSVRIDTLIRTVLRNPPMTRPVIPARPALDAASRDSLLNLLTTSERYADAVTQENRMLRSVLDSAATIFDRYRSAADSTIEAQMRQLSAQQRQIVGLQGIIEVRECRILGLLKCPSRTVAAIGGAVLGAGAVIYVKR